MEDQIKKIDIKEFREKGYLQELNRRFLHPLGLALEISIDDDGNEKIGGIWDYREDKEGIYYDIANSDLERKNRFIEKKLFIDNEFENRCKNRKEILGFDIEPLMKTPEEILNEVAAENMINIQQMVTAKQLVIIAMRRYAKLYHDSEAKKLIISDVSESVSKEDIDGSGLFFFNTRLDDKTKLKIVKWYKNLSNGDRKFVDILRNESSDKADYFSQGD